MNEVVYLLYRDVNWRRFPFKGVALIEQHPAGPIIRGVFPANLLIEKNRLSDIAVKLWILPRTEKLSESIDFTYALFDEIDALCAAVFYKNNNIQHILCAFFEAAHSDSVWARMGKIKGLLQTHKLKLRSGMGDIIKSLESLYGEFMKLFNRR